MTTLLIAPDAAAPAPAMLVLQSRQIAGVVSGTTPSSCHQPTNQPLDDLTVIAGSKLPTVQAAVTPPQGKPYWFKLVDAGVLGEITCIIIFVGVLRSQHAQVVRNKQLDSIKNENTRRLAPNCVWNPRRSNKEKG
jgi:hypothetical protein